MTNYTDTATQHKITALKQFVAQIDNLNMVWDMGSNDGFYSRVIASSGVTVVCFDIDPLAVEKNYKKTKQEQGITLLPLLQDLTNPSSSIGWAQVERDGLNKRGTADLIMALALIHHLAISNHVPLNLIAAYFSSLGDYLIIEFVPKEDLQVKKLLANIKDIYDQYDLNHFKQAFSLFYDFLAEEPLIETSRTLFFMKKRSLNVKKI